VVDVALDRFRSEEELLTDAMVRKAFRHQGEDLALMGGELVEWVVWSAAAE
jgi:hypothetical protein